ncbi:DUF7260 family protein [Halosolutus gelatinilyticus]|uniref:DUF7260 family protein n=1 Tax=Halosolutus gelatinilyticus TaxID=2931975 RepID=UPI001FF63548|nr:hypothetical protein [Halosolutus gelatinilyticus]
MDRAADTVRSDDCHLAAARRILRTERRWTVDEKSAFETFRERLRSVPTAPSRTRTGPGALVEPAGGRGLADVRDAYESTVMAMPHYDAEYGDSYEESIDAEFGSGVAAALAAGTALDPQCKRALLAQTVQAIEERDRFREQLETERTSVRSAATRLAPIREELSAFDADALSSEPFGSLDARRTRLVLLEGRCEEIVADRQASIRETRRSVPLPDGEDLQRYLYRELPVAFPVLSAVTTATEELEAARLAVERAMGYCR